MLLRTLLAAVLLAGLLPDTAAAQGVGGTGGNKPGLPVSPFTPFGGGQTGAPPDSGVPDDGGGTSGDGPTSDDPTGQRPSSGGRGSSSRGGSATTAGRATSGGAAAIPVTPPDHWLTWWETNKFDFIRLRRVEDAPYTGQGRQQETPEARRQRLESNRRLVRESVLPIIRDLTAADDPAVRASSIVALAKLQDADGTAHARDLLQDGSYAVRRAAMLAMGVLDAGRSSYLLMNIADDSALGRSLLDTTSISDEDRGVALLTAALRGDKASEVLLDGLLEDRQDLSPEVLASACDAAGLMGSVSSIPALTAVALDDDLPEFVRSSATTALGRVGDPAAIPGLLAILETGLEPKRAAMVALGLVAHRGLLTVVTRLAVALENESDAPTRHFAAISLGRIGGEAARSSLEAAFRKPRTDMKPWLALALALCERQDPQGSVPDLLLERLDEEANVETKGAYLIALGLAAHSGDRIPDPRMPWARILLTLEEELASGGPQVAGQAALALGLTGHPDASTILTDQLADANSPLLQRQIALGLGILGNSAAVPALLELIETTRNPFVASFAAIGIAFMGDADAIGPLLRIIEHAGPGGVTTTYAVLAVGQLFDTDRRPALTRLAAGDNYLARPTAVTNLLALGF